MGLRELPAPLRAALEAIQDATGIAGPELRDKREAICQRCPKLIREALPRCGVCYCPIVSKFFRKRAHCPDNPPRW